MVYKNPIEWPIWGPRVNGVKVWNKFTTVSTIMNWIKDVVIEALHIMLGNKNPT